MNYFIVCACYFGSIFFYRAEGEPSKNTLKKIGGIILIAIGVISVIFLTLTAYNWAGAVGYNEAMFVAATFGGWGIFMVNSQKPSRTHLRRLFIVLNYIVWTYALIIGMNPVTSEMEFVVLACSTICFFINYYLKGGHDKEAADKKLKR